ncbi:MULTISPECIES: helix-turn-helix domain-containing protein [Sinorhizobium/Ensifer group]|uniref:Helix-turn-helix domain-containing protein n=1 Tax=Rhizobium fredii TaxID=380 RepID=A0A2A6LNI1_RHIFR|nr:MULTISPECIES: helix-turn-helix domain-containing protein [Sinorhizobium]MCK3780918.1 helix-turn-helix domain-containing protein [Ensifer sesbaniae]MQW94946.1 helix-turn-helix domain-containing protein [Sinorhizobium fredii]MQX08350.1 helix-turn-helix domain-containing protein [Sinorhizobium fredii]PDT44111.1 XRE family transcriptional regulator [Sinorhizobium fredii]UTY47734.1 XRE family transcriptional regulator [Sinorhizobium fredii]
MKNLIHNVGPNDARRDHVDIGDAVRRSREAVGYSVDDLALTCGLTCAEISRIELGADVDPERLRRVVAALRVPATTFALKHS